MPEFNTLEDARAEIVRLNTELTRVNTENETLSRNNAELNRTVAEVRDINQQYFLRLQQQTLPEEDDSPESAKEEVQSSEEFALNFKWGKDE